MTINANANANANVLPATVDAERAARDSLAALRAHPSARAAHAVLDVAQRARRCAADALAAAESAANGDGVDVTLHSLDGVRFAFANGATIDARFVPHCAAHAFGENAVDSDGYCAPLFGGEIRDALDDGEHAALAFIYGRRAVLAASLADATERTMIAVAVAAGIAQRFADIAGNAARAIGVDGALGERTDDDDRLAACIVAGDAAWMWDDAFKLADNLDATI